MSCAYPSCHISRNQGVRFHRFPVNKERAMQWAIICQSPELIELVSQGIKFYGNKRLCSLHFERPAFMNDLRISLTKLAVPTIFADRPKPTESSSSRPSPSSTNAVTNVDSSCENSPTAEKVQQLNGNTSKLHYTLAEIIAETVGLDNNQSSQDFFYDDEDLPQLLCETNAVEGSEELHAADIDLPQIGSDIDLNKDTQELFTNGKSMFATIALQTSKTRSPIQTVVPTKEKSALFGIDENSSKELLCRLCANLVSISHMMNIFGTSSSSKEYLRQMNQLLPYSEQPAKDDCLPKWICNVCCERLNYCDQVIHDFTSASVKLNHLVSTPLSKKHKALMAVNLTSTRPNSRSATRQDNNESVQDDTMIIKEEYLGNEQFEEGSFDSIHHSTKQQQIHTINNANTQQIGDNKSMHHASQKRTFMKLCSTNNFPDSHPPQCPCSQCVDVFSDKCSRLIITAHMSESKYKRNVLREPQTIYMSVPSDPDCSFSKSVPLDDIECPIKRKEYHVDDDLQPISVPSCPMFIKMESVDYVSTGSITNKQFTTTCSQPRKVKQTRRRHGECQGNMIESSHTMIPTASDNKTFLCKKCNMSFGSIESALTHRFKEHPEEEIRRTRPQ